MPLRRRPGAAQRHEHERRGEHPHPKGHHGEHHHAGNHGARMAIFGGANGQPPALEMEQQILPTVSNVTTGGVTTFQLRNVGLIRGLNLLIRGTITGGGTSTQTLTALGLANLVSQVDFQDYSTYHRITTTGWHLNLLQSRKREQPWLSAFTTDNPTGFANNNPATPTLTSISGLYTASTISANGNSKFQMIYRIPFCRDRFDLRGALWAKVTQASAFVFVTLNPNMFVTSTQDPTLAVYQSAGSDLATLSAVTMECYQDYLDQIPRGSDGVEILPWGDLEDAYLLTNTVSPQLVQGQDNSVSFTDQRQFLSAAAIYDNDGALNKWTDISYWMLAAANLTPIFKRSPIWQSSRQRELFKDDLPAGMYFFDFMHRPIDTQAYGNVQLVVNPSIVSGTPAVLYLGYEMFGRIGSVVKAQAIPSGG